MAKKVRFPLKMKGTDVRTIEELREHFDLESVLGYFINGKLVTWLRDHYYDNEAMVVEALAADDSDLNQKLMTALGVAKDTGTEEIDMEAIQRRNEKLMKLRQFTDDQTIIDNLDNVAFSQVEFQNLLDCGVGKIYLFKGEFVIKAGEGYNYSNLKEIIGVGNPKLEIRYVDGTIEEKEALIIKIKNCICSFSAEDNCDALYRLAFAYEHYCQDKEKAVKIYTESANKGNVDAQLALAHLYLTSMKESKEDALKAYEWYEKAANNGDADACYYLASYFYAEKNKAIKRDYDKAIEYYLLAAKKGNIDAMWALADGYRWGEPSGRGKGFTQNYNEALKWYERACDSCLNSGSNDTSIYSINIELAGEYLEEIYESTRINKYHDAAINFYKVSASMGEERAVEKLKKLGINIVNA